MIIIAVIAGNKTEFDDWVHRDCVWSYDTKVMSLGGTITMPDRITVLKYVGPEGGGQKYRGLEFKGLIKVGRWYETWTQEQLADLIARVR